MNRSYATHAPAFFRTARNACQKTKPEIIVISGIHFRLVSSRIFFKFSFIVSLLRWKFLYEVIFFASVWLHDNFILNQIKIFCVNDTKHGLDWTLNPPLHLHIHTQLCSWIQIQQSPHLALVWQLLFLKSDNKIQMNIRAATVLTGSYRTKEGDKVGKNHPPVHHLIHFVLSHVWWLITSSHLTVQYLAIIACIAWYYTGGCWENSRQLYVYIQMCSCTVCKLWNC